jgi:phenylalanyl-tRNA synthetase alpha chain
MSSLQQLIDKNKAEVEAYLISKAEELEQYRIEFLGTKGKIKDIMGAMKDVPKEMKREAGLMLNELKQKAEEKYEAYKEKFGDNSNKNNIHVRVCSNCNRSHLRSMIKSIFCNRC